MSTQLPSRFSASTKMYGNKKGNNQFRSEEDIRRELTAFKLDEHEADIRIASLEVHYGKYVEAIGIQYEITGSAKGDKAFTVLHGKLKAGLAIHRIVLHKDEVFIGVDIWAGDIIDAVQFYVAKINEGGIPKLTELKETKKCGGAGGTKYSMKRDGTIIGFFGTAGAYGSDQVIHTLGTLFLGPKLKMPELPKMPLIPGMPKMPDMPKK